MFCPDCGDPVRGTAAPDVTGTEPSSEPPRNSLGNGRRNWIVGAVALFAIVGLVLFFVSRGASSPEEACSLTGEFYASALERELTKDEIRTAGERIANAASGTSVQNTARSLEEAFAASAASPTDANLDRADEWLNKMTDACSERGFD